jgi:hypothetical protein
MRCVASPAFPDPRRIGARIIQSHPKRAYGAAARAALPTAGLALVLALCGPSCGLLSGHNQASAEALARAEKLTRLQFEVMSLADQAILDVSGSARQFSRAVGTPDAKRQALSWTVSCTNRVLSIAANPKPLSALVDLLLYASLQRIFHEEYWLPKVHGEADRPMLAAFQRLEAACWEAVKTRLNAKQQDALRAVLTAWREHNPDLGSAVAVESPSFRDVVAPGKGGDRVPVVSDLIDLVSLDPLAGLEPAVQEVTTARQLGERMFFYTQHMPRLLEQELELFTQRTASLPEVRTTLEGAERFSLAAESLAATAAQLPETLRDERAGLLELLAQGRETLDAGTQTANSITGGIAALDAFVSRTDAAHAASPVDAAPVRPFDVAEYGAAATSIGAAARELGAAITTADQHLPGAQLALDEAALRVERSVDHAYGRALRLLFWTVGLLSGAVLLVRLVWWILPHRPRPAARGSRAAEAWTRGPSL